MEQNELKSIKIPSNLIPVIYAYKNGAYDQMGIPEFEANVLKTWANNNQKVIDNVKSYNIAFDWLIWSALSVEKGAFFIGTDGFHRGGYFADKFHQKIKEVGLVEKEHYLLQGRGKLVILPTGSVIEWINLEEMPGDPEYSCLWGHHFVGGVTSTRNGLDILLSRISSPLRVFCHLQETINSGINFS